MKNKFLTLFQIIAITSFFAVTVLGSGAGTADDPVVTKSYVDKCISDALSTNKISKNDIINEVLSKIETTNDNEVPIVTETSEYNNYKAVELKKGKIILGEEGTEIILRSGIAFAYITGVDSILDISTGTSLIDKNSISKNHLIIIPRGDGRGIRATEDAWILVKGKYSIEDYKA